VPDATRAGGLGFAGGLFADSPEEAMAGLGRALEGIGLSLGDLVKLGVFYVPGSVDGVALPEALAAALPAGCRPAATMVPVEALAGPGALLVEGVAAEGEKRALAGPGPFAEAVRCGELLLTSAVTVGEAPGDIVRQTELVIARLREILAELGCELDDTVKANIYYVGTGTKDDWEVAARIRGGAFREPAGAATGIPVPGFREDGVVTSIELWAMRGEDGAPLPREHFWPEGHWDWPIHLPWKHGYRCGGLAFVGGQVSLRGFGEVVDPGRLEVQTQTAMENIDRVLHGFGLGLEDAVKLTAFYEDRGQLLALDAGNAAATVVALPYLAYREMVVEIEAIAAAAS
jgi:enamine deaminase RidA (YjgF/YER057c/UK114 family)